jgi:hypothetical protein
MEAWRRARRGACAAVERVEAWRHGGVERCSPWRVCRGGARGAMEAWRGIELCAYVPWSIQYHVVERDMEAMVISVEKLKLHAPFTSLLSPEHRAARQWRSHPNQLFWRLQARGPINHPCDSRCSPWRLAVRARALAAALEPLEEADAVEDLLARLALERRHCPVRRLDDGVAYHARLDAHKLLVHVGLPHRDRVRHAAVLAAQEARDGEQPLAQRLLVDRQLVAQRDLRSRGTNSKLACHNICSPRARSHAAQCLCTR